jgi:hypothetical protein
MKKNKPNYENLKFNKDTDFDEYFTDICLKKNIIDTYITNFKNNINKHPEITNNIKKIYISGKINKHSEITKLNIGLSRLDTKSDIYIELLNDDFIGLSIKQSKQATKSNYSVQKILPKETDIRLTQIKKNYLIEKEFPKYNKSNREKVNSLFYPQNKENPYMNSLKEEIKINQKIILTFLIEKLNCYNINYNIYEFNGIEISKLEKTTSNSTFEHYEPYYYDTKGNERKAAKLFYRLIHGNKTYRVEIRWKGNIHNSSPQFQIHEE